MIANILNYKKNTYFALVILVSALIVYLLVELNNGRFGIPDFEVYYKAAVRFLNGENLFRHDEDGFFRYKYSPSGAFFFTPFAIFPLFPAKIIYWILSAFVIAGCFRLSGRMAIPNFSTALPAYINHITGIALLVLGSFIEAEMHLGQVNYLNLLLFLAMAYFYLKDKPHWIGFFWSITLYLKPFGLIFLPYFLVKKQFKAIGWMLGFALLWFITPILFYDGWSSIIAQNKLWINEMQIELGNKQHLLADRNFTIFSVVARYTPLRYLVEFTPVVSQIYQLIVLALLGGLVLWTIVANKIQESPSVYEFAILLGLIPLIATTGRGMFSFFMLGIFLILIHFKSLSIGLKILAIIGFVLMGMTIGELWGVEMANRINDLSLLSIGAIIQLGLLFWIVLRRQKF